MRKYFIIGMLLVFALPSCITIIQSLVTQDNIVADDRLAGTWIGVDSKNITVQKIMDSKLRPTSAELAKHDYTKADSLFFTKFYFISFQENNLNYELLAGLVKINGEYYLNLKSLRCLDNKGEEAYELEGNKFQSTSTIARLEWRTNNSLNINFFNGDHIKEIILNGKARIGYEYDSLFGSFVITASSKELEKFLEKYGNNESLFKKGTTINLVRKL
ncbi:MAG: hypothetical protein ABIP80_01360 [Ferruginibacter sp.]